VNLFQTKVYVVVNEKHMQLRFLGPTVCGDAVGSVLGVGAGVGCSPTQTPLMRPKSGRHWQRPLVCPKLACTHISFGPHSAMEPTLHGFSFSENPKLGFTREKMPGKVDYLMTPQPEDCSPEQKQREQL
jgi:hypothetical protein